MELRLGTVAMGRGLVRIPWGKGGVRCKEKGLKLGDCRPGG